SSPVSSQASSTTPGLSTPPVNSSPYHSSHASTQPAYASTVTRHSHKSRRSVDQDTAFTTSTATSLPDSKLPVITDSSAQAHSAGPDFFKPEQDVPRTAFLDQQHYYQHTFQHQFQFSYSPPSNCKLF